MGRGVESLGIAVQVPMFKAAGTSRCYGTAVVHVLFYTWYLVICSFGIYIKL